MQITLYSTGCPKCRILTKKMNAINLEYEVVTDTQKMIDKGFKSAPVLEVDGEALTFPEAIKWINEQ